MQAQQVQSQAQHQQLSGANVILKMNDIQQLSAVGQYFLLLFVLFNHNKNIDRPFVGNSQLICDVAF